VRYDTTSQLGMSQRHGVTAVTDNVDDDGDDVNDQSLPDQVLPSTPRVPETGLEPSSSFSSPSAPMSHPTPVVAAPLVAAAGVIPDLRRIRVESVLPYPTIILLCSGVPVDVGRGTEIIWSGNRNTGHKMYYIPSLNLFYVPSPVYVTGTLWDGSLSASCNDEASTMAAELVFALVSTAVRAGQPYEAALTSAMEVIARLYKTQTDMATALYHDQILRRFCGVKVLTDDPNTPENPAAIIKLNQTRRFFLIPPTPDQRTRDFGNIKDVFEPHKIYTIALPACRSTESTSIDLTKRIELPDHIRLSPVGDAMEFFFRPNSLRQFSNDKRNYGKPTVRPTWHNQVILAGGPTPSNRTTTTQFLAVSATGRRMPFVRPEEEPGVPVVLSYFEELAALDPLDILANSTPSPAILVIQHRFSGVRRKGAVSVVDTSAIAIAAGQLVSRLPPAAPLTIPLYIRATSLGQVPTNAPITLPAAIPPTTATTATPMATDDADDDLTSAWSTTTIAFGTVVGNAATVTTVAPNVMASTVPPAVSYRRGRGRPKGSLTVNRKVKVPKLEGELPARQVKAEKNKTLLASSKKTPATKRKQSSDASLPAPGHTSDSASESLDADAGVVVNFKKVRADVDSPPSPTAGSGNKHAHNIFSTSEFGSHHDGTDAAVSAAYAYEQRSIDSSFTVARATTNATSSNNSDDGFNFLSGVIRVPVVIPPQHRAFLLQLAEHPEKFGQDIARFFNRQHVLKQHILNKYVSTEPAYIEFSRATVPKWSWISIVDAEESKAYEHFCMGVTWAFYEFLELRGLPPKFSFFSVPEENAINIDACPGVKMVGQSLIDEKTGKSCIEWGVQALQPFAKDELIGYLLCDVLQGSVYELEGRAALRMSVLEVPNEAAVTDNYVIRNVIVPGIDGKCYATGESQIHQLTSVLGKVNTGPNRNAEIRPEYDLDKGGLPVTATRSINTGDFIVFDYGTEYTDSLIADGLPVLKLGDVAHDATTLKPVPSTSTTSTTSSRPANAALTPVYLQNISRAELVGLRCSVYLNCLSQMLGAFRASPQQVQQPPVPVPAVTQSVTSTSAVPTALFDPAFFERMAAQDELEK
jgi:hypothetical protein